MFIKKLFFIEDYFRFQYVGFIVVIVAFLASYVDFTLLKSLPFVAVLTFSIMHIFKKTERESIACMFFRDHFSEILSSFLILLTSVSFLLIFGAKASLKINFILFLLLFYSLISLFFSITAKIKANNFTMNKVYPDRIHLGMKKDFLFYGPVLLQERKDPSHSLTFGVTGSAKTIGVLYPKMKHDIANNKFVVIIEPKGDKELRDMIYSLCQRHNRTFKFISISNASISSKYNPFGFGDANAVKDKILSSTDWSEQFYKKVADSELLKVLNKIEKDNVSTSRSILNNGFSLKNIVALLPDIKELAGLKAFFESVNLSSYSSIFSANGETMYDFYKNNDVIFISLDSLTYPIAAQSLGRIVLQDLSTLNGYIINNISKDERKKVGIYIDEMATFFSTGFLTFLSQTRSANITIDMACQSPSDFKAHGDWALARLVDNTPIKFILALQDPDSAEYCAKILGTEDIVKQTHQTENDGEVTGKGSMRDAHRFYFSPDTIKELPPFHGIVYDRIAKVRVMVKFKTIFFDETKIVHYTGPLKMPAEATIVDSKSNIENDLTSSNTSTEVSKTNDNNLLPSAKSTLIKKTISSKKTNRSFVDQIR